MKGLKTASGVIAVLEGLVILLGGIFFVIIDKIGAKIFDSINGIIESLLSFVDTLPSLGGLLLILAGLILVIFGLIYMVLGIKACTKISGKGTMIAMLIFSLFSCNLLVIIFCIVYLATRGKKNQKNYSSGGSGGGKDYSSDDTYV